MHKIELEQYTPETVTQLLSGIPFFKALQQEDPKQFATLLKYSAFYEAGPSEEIIRKGSLDSTYYFLIRGQLFVYPEKNQSLNNSINYIASGQIFGALASICNTERTASIIADPNNKQPALLFASKAEPFGKLEDFSTIFLSTKLSFYRMVVHNTRWKIEVYKMSHPTHPLVEQLRSLELFSGEKDSLDELHSLHIQIHQLKSLLIQWNSSLTMKEDIPEKA